MKRINAPFVHTDKTVFSHAAEWLVAIVPVLIWSVFMFGARVITVCAISALFSIGFDYPVRRFILKRVGIAQFDPMTGIYGVLTAFMMPVSVPLWIPMIGAALVVVAKNIRIIRAKRLFNPFVFSATALHVFFSSQMTAFTRPFAYFNAFSFSIDDKLMESYRVISPLQYMADGSVYEDGVFAQLYGFASGNMGEIAIAAIILSFAWLCIRREADWRGTVAFLVPVLLLALIFPSDDAESNYYAYSIILSGAMVFLAVFATNESHTVPMTALGRIIFGAICGITVFALRKTMGGFEAGYIVILLLNAVSPYIEQYTKPSPLGEPKKARKPKSVKTAKGTKLK
jgi:electron transport complex protein RnfD